MSNQGHGHVTPREDGIKARCGGPGICSECSVELAHKKNEYDVERVHGDNMCGGPERCSHCAIRFAKIFRASAGIVLAKDIRPQDTLVVAISRRLDDYSADRAKSMLSEMLSCKVVLLPECEALAVIHGEEGDCDASGAN